MHHPFPVSAARAAAALLVVHVSCGCEKGSCDAEGLITVSALPPEHPKTPADIPYSQLRSLVSDPTSILPSGRSVSFDTLINVSSGGSDVPSFDLLMNSADQTFVVLHHHGFCGLTTQHGPFAMDTSTGAVRLLR